MYARTNLPGESLRPDGDALVRILTAFGSGFRPACSRDSGTRTEARLRGVELGVWVSITHSHYLDIISQPGFVQAVRKLVRSFTIRTLRTVCDLGETWFSSSFLSEHVIMYRIESTSQVKSRGFYLRSDWENTSIWMLWRNAQSQNPGSHGPVVLVFYEE